VQADSLSQIADELYGLVPAQFTTARDARSREARAAGHRETAAEIKKLTRPTAGAWLVNQLVRGAAAQMDRLFEIGQALQDAQRELNGELMRELSAQRRQVITELVPEAARLAAAAGQPASAGVLDEVRVTLEAAVADPAAGAAVRSGRLTRALAYAGLGEVDLTAATAVLPAGERRPAGQGVPAKGPGAARGGPRPETARTKQPGTASADKAAKAAQARAALAEAQADAQAADGVAAQAEEKAASVAEQRQFLQRRIENLRRDLDQATAEEAQLLRESKQVKRELEIATRRQAAAHRRLAQARERAASD
jgi:hypothetical protein